MAKQAVRTWQNRVVGQGNADPHDLIAHPLNFRTHPKPQQDALAGAIGDLGWLVPVIVNQTTGHVLDGHLRVELALSRSEPSVPVTYVELPAELEAEALLTIDPIAALAQADAQHLDMLLREVVTGDAAVQKLLADLGAKHHLPDYETAASKSLANWRDRFEVVVECDSEAAQAALYERLTAEGLRCRALTM